MTEIEILDDLESLLERYFEGLHSGGGRSSIRGGQTAANDALANLDIRGYASRRSEVLPVTRRGASVLSPHIRHNLLTLKQVWNHVDTSPTLDRDKFRDELLWQEYARHLYARIGTRLFEDLRFEQPKPVPGDGWTGDLACISFVLDELNRDGWLVNQPRMWLASHWSVRNGTVWQDGQDRMYRELIDGSRAANLLGWQWTAGLGTGKSYGFARWQVEKRAPGLCESCPLSSACPIQQFPKDQELSPAVDEPLLRSDPNPGQTAGPVEPERRATPEFVLLTIDSLGDRDPALVANPDLPAVFVFNETALRKLQLSSKRIYFYLETFQDLATRRDMRVLLGDPVQFALENPVAMTFAPVPSFAKFTNIAELHPYPWLREPHHGSVKSFSAWRGR